MNNHQNDGYHPFPANPTNMRGNEIMRGIDLNCFAGPMHLYQIIPASPGWYADLYDLDTSKVEMVPIAAFGLIHGPGDRGTRLVGLRGDGPGLEPVDCYEDYVRTVYQPNPEKVETL
jgi:hypothetical protein